jgi:hypothetical protein
MVAAAGCRFDADARTFDLSATCSGRKRAIDIERMGLPFG